MKNYITKERLVILLLIIVIISSVLFLLRYDLKSRDDHNDLVWTFQEKEIITRLKKIPILLYHNIDGKGPFSIGLSELRKHFEVFKKNNIRVITLSELHRRLRDLKPFKEKVAVITFDDGYISNYTKLLPLAKEFNYPVTLFVYTDFIYSRGKKLMTWKNLREMDSSLVDIQCHSISHSDLTELTKKGDKESRRELFNELYLSKRIIELYLGKTINFFAFPYGRYDLDLISYTKSSGFERVFSTDYGPNIISRDNFCLRRQHVKNTFSVSTIIKFLLK